MQTRRWAGARTGRKLHVLAAVVVGVALGAQVPAAAPLQAAETCRVEVNGFDPYYNNAQTLPGSDVQVVWAPDGGSVRVTGTARIPGEMRTPGAVADVRFDTGAQFTIGNAGPGYGTVQLDDADASDFQIRTYRPLTISVMTGVREGDLAKFDGWATTSNGIPKLLFTVRVGGPGCSTQPTTTTTTTSTTTTTTSTSTSLPPTTIVSPTSNPPLAPTTIVSPASNPPATPVSGDPTLAG